MSVRVDATVERVASSEIHLAVNIASQCARCASGVGCGMGLFGSDRKRLVLPLDGIEKLPRTGDRVTLSCNSSVLLGDAVRGYGLPLTGLVAGASLAALMGGGDVMVAVAGLCGAVAIAMAGRSLTRSAGVCRRWKLCQP